MVFFKVLRQKSKQKFETVNFVYFQSCNRTHAEEGDNSLRERYREKSAEVRQLQSKIMVSRELLPQMDRSYIASFPLANFFQGNLMHGSNLFCNLQYDLKRNR